MEGLGAGGTERGSIRLSSFVSDYCRVLLRITTGQSTNAHDCWLLETAELCIITGRCAEYYLALLLVTADCGLLQTLRIITGYCRTAELRTTAHYYWLLETVQSTTATYCGTADYCALLLQNCGRFSHLSASED